MATRGQKRASSVPSYWKSSSSKTGVKSRGLVVEGEGDMLGASVLLHLPEAPSDWFNKQMNGQ